MNLVSALPIALLGAVIGLDVVSFPQILISRPIVASTIAGAFTGSAENGLLIGAVLELIALKTLPFGASRYPEWGSTSVVGGALYGVYPFADGGALVAVTLAALITASVSGWSMIRLRHRNVRRVRLAHYAVEHGSRRAVLTVQMYSLMEDLLRGGVLTFAALIILQPFVSAISDIWPVEPLISRTVVAALAGIVAIGAVRKLVH